MENSLRLVNEPAHWHECDPYPLQASVADLSSSTASKLNRKESYKAQRQNYRREKKRVASELLNSLQDPAVIVLADWLKVRKAVVKKRSHIWKYLSCASGARVA